MPHPTVQPPVPLSEQHVVQIICDNSQVGGIELWRRMETGHRFNCRFIERSLPGPLFLIIDANTAVCLIIEDDMIEHANGNAEGNYANNRGDENFRAVCDQLIYLSMSFHTVWVVLDCKDRTANSTASSAPSSYVDTMPGSRASAKVQVVLKVQKWIQQLKSSLACK